jgi:hypothetical protein
MFQPMRVAQSRAEPTWADFNAHFLGGLLAYDRQYESFVETNSSKVLGLYLERPLEAVGRSEGLVDGRFGYSDLKGAVAGSRAYGFCIWSE